MADAGVLRLYTFYHWVQDVMKECLRARTSSETFADRAFANEMNRLIELTAKHYDATNFKEAIKTGFFEYQAARDNYKQLCGSDANMREDLVSRYITTQALILSPICPHICEKIWHEFGSGSETDLIVDARWPCVEPVDGNLVEQNEFVHRAVRDFRLRREQKLNPKKKSSTLAPPKEATVYIAKRQPEWKLEIVRTLKKLYDENGAQFPPNKVISQQVGKQHKDAMPFVQLIREKVDKAGGEFIAEEESEIDQQEVLESIHNYLLSTLQLEKLCYVDIEGAEGVPEDIKKSTSPGSPLIMFQFGRDDQ